MNRSNGSYLNLHGLLPDGSIPESRLNDPIAVQAIVQQIISGNRKRSKFDATVLGLFAGNPPFSQAKLIAQGQGWRNNSNWRIAEAFRNVGRTMYWDMVAEANPKAEVRTRFGNDDQQDDWSGIITEEFERLNHADTSLNYMFRISQDDMVLFRCGPVVFEDAFDFRSRAIKQSNLLVDDGTPSNLDDWTLAIARMTYKADQLYAFIRNPAAAAKVGYDVEAVRKVLIDYVPNTFWPANRRNDWLFYQEQITNNDLHMSRVSEEIPVVHVWYREFPKDGETKGRISHCMVLEEYDMPKFLFRHVGRVEKWQNIIHPFYYDTGDGTHHSVKGLGIKAYGALETYNRLQCHLVDSAMWGSSMHMQARDASAMENLAIMAMGPYIMHPPGADFIPMQMGQNLEGPMAIKQDLMDTVTSNLSQYRQDVQRRRHGAEPPTARQVNYEAENENIIGRSGMTWYLEQLDDFYTERYRRAANPNLTYSNLGGKEALEFQDRCLKRGVAKEALVATEYVRATRTVGFGSADARMQALLRMLQRLPTYDESGRQHVLEDLDAADVGYSRMRRYRPKNPDTPYLADQRAEAVQWVGSMKLGIAPEASPSQNPVIYAGVWLKAASDAAASLQQGANPMEVFSLLEIVGPAIRQQLDRFANDPTRKDVYDQMNQQWQQLSSLHDQLQASLQKQQADAQKRQAQLQQQNQQQNSEQALAQQDLNAKLAISDRKQRGNFKLRQQGAVQQENRKNLQALGEEKRKNMIALGKVQRDAAAAKETK